MEIFEKLNHNPNLSICLGFFDGVHQGHKVVLKNTVNLALQNNLKSAVITFKEHPLCYLQNRTPQYIIQPQDRLEFFEKQGIDYVYMLDFDEDIADLIAFDYLKDVLVKNFQPKFITTGFNHFFGANKQGDSAMLRAYQSEFGYKYYEIPPITYDNTLISSSKIRQLVAQGSVDCIKNLLGEYFYVKGRVPPKGSYVTVVEIDGSIYKAITNLGKRPTVTCSNTLLLEAHLIDFNENIYDKDIKVSLVKKIRDEKKFDSLPDLKSQIVKDEIFAKEFFDSNKII